jgi:hypothetical protein
VCIAQHGGEIFASHGKRIASSECATLRHNGGRGATRTGSAHLLRIQIGRIQQSKQLVQTLGPVSRLQRAEQSHDGQAGSVANHDGLVGESLQDGGFRELGDLRRRLHDETRVVLEEVSGDRADAVFFLRKGGEDVGEIGYIVRRTRELVKFLLVVSDEEVRTDEH